MALHGGIDTVSFASIGVYSETYGSAELKNLCNLFALYGILEDAPNIGTKIACIAEFYKRLREL